MLIDRITLQSFPDDYPDWKSPEGHLLNLEWNEMFNPDVLSTRKPNLWRYREALPIHLDSNIVSIDEGYTPLLPLTFWGKRVWIKQEQLFSTGSYKDRGATVLMSHVKSLGIRHVIQDSSGNAGCAVAAYAVHAGISCDIYLQKNTSPGKIVQMQMYGANIIKIDGSREDVAYAARNAAEHAYYASHSYNPYFVHGTKTFAYEVCEQMHWNAPDAVVLPVGNGTLLLGCYIGFSDLLKAGIIHRMPKLIAIQSEQVAPLALAFETNQKHPVPVVNQYTLAEGIAVAEPVRGDQILEYVRATHGMFFTVTESEIAEAWNLCGKMGFYIEPTSAATLAGLKKYISGYESGCVVSLFSGHGLKSTEKALSYAGK